MVTQSVILYYRLCTITDCVLKKCCLKTTTLLLVFDTPNNDLASHCVIVLWNIQVSMYT